MPKLTSAQQAEKIRIADEGYERWCESDEAGRAWFIAQYHNEVANSRAKSPKWAACQKIFTTDPSCLKLEMQRQHPDLKNNAAFMSATLQTLCKEEYEAAIQQKDEQAEEKIKSGKVRISSGVKLCDTMEETSENLTSLAEAHESCDQAVPTDVLMPIGIGLLFVLCCHPDEIDPRCTNPDGSIKREDGHTPVITDWEFMVNGWNVIKHNGSKGRKRAVRPPRGIVTLFNPQLVQRMLRVWFAHIHTVKPDTTSFCLSWHYGGGRFQKDMKRFGLDQIVTPIGTHNMHLYDVKGWGLKCFDLIHDVTKCCADPATAIISARRAQAGHFKKSAANEHYTAMRIEDCTGFEDCAGYEPRKKRLKLNDEDLAVIESDYDTGMESDCEDASTHYDTGMESCDESNHGLAQIAMD